MGRLTVVATLLCAALCGPAAHAQGGRTVRPSTTDAALASGDLDAAERALYAAVRLAPRDPSARAELGAWLASRGQLRIGAVLLEEARLFGGDAASIAARLVHIYTWLRDWSSLAALPASPLSPAERARAVALAGRETTVQGADTVQLTFAPLEVGTLGRLPMVIGIDTLWGELDPQVEGIVLPGLGRGAGVVEVVGDDARGPVAIVREMALGALTLRNVPARVDGTLGEGRARLGFDVFARLAPTVDSRAGVVTLRRGGKVDARGFATGTPMLLGFPGVRLVVPGGGPLVLLVSPAGRTALRGHPWTVDLRRGLIWTDGGR